jgi:hypothetical protein
MKAFLFPHHIISTDSLCLSSSADTTTPSYSAATHRRLDLLKWLEEKVSLTLDSESLVALCFFDIDMMICNRLLGAVLVKCERCDSVAVVAAAF